VKPSATFLPLKKIRADHGLLVRPTTSGKSRAAIKSVMSSYFQDLRHFLGSSFLVPSESFVSEQDVGVHPDDSIDSLLRTVYHAERFVVSSDSSSFSGTFGIEVDAFSSSSVPSTSVATKVVDSSARPLLKRKKKKAATRSSLLLPTSVSVGVSNLDGGGEDDFSEGELLFGRVRSVADVDRNIFGEVYIPEWNVPCGSRLETAADCREMVDGFAPPMFFFKNRKMDL
jgi:hypothetical protein